jgi:hypothetical protein
MRTERAISSQPHADVTTVKGIPFFRMPAPFAGLRKNEELGWSASLAGAPLLSMVAPVTSDVLWNPKEGNDVRGRTKQAHAPHRRGNQMHSPARETRPSLGPETRARKSSLNLLGDTPRG